MYQQIYVEYPTEKVQIIGRNTRWFKQNWNL